MRAIEVGFHYINRIIVYSWGGKAVKDIVVYLGDGVITDYQDSAIAEGVLVDVSAGKEGGWVDMVVEVIRRSILVNSRKDSNRASLGGIVSEATNPFDKAPVTVAAVDPHIKP